MVEIAYECDRSNCDFRRVDVRNVMSRRVRETVMGMLLPMLLLFLAGCMETSLTFSVEFSDVSGLKKDDLVYFGRNEIGSVEKVTYTNKGNFLVEVNIATEFKEAVTEDSQFYIGPAPVGEAKAAVIVEQERPGGTILEKGATVAGSTREGYFDRMFDDLRDKAQEAEGELSKAFEKWKNSYQQNSKRMEQELESALEDLSRQFDTYKQELGKLPDSEEMKQFEESFNEFAEEFGKAQQELQDHLREEVLPRFREELDRLRRQLEKEGREQELEKIDEQIKELEMV